MAGEQLDLLNYNLQDTKPDQLKIEEVFRLGI